MDWDVSFPTDFSFLLRACVCVVNVYMQEGMQNQVNMNQVNLNQVNMNVETSSSTNQPQFIIQGIPAIQGGVVNLTELLNKANTGTKRGNGHVKH